MHPTTAHLLLGMVVGFAGICAAILLFRKLFGSDQ